MCKESRGDHVAAGDLCSEGCGRNKLFFSDNFPALAALSTVQEERGWEKGFSSCVVLPDLPRLLSWYLEDKPKRAQVEGFGVSPAEGHRSR